ncbi:unnamed protein product [Rotaria sp. Silwood1]|nr:unnamed protein product [Rotaria sp. Silwood1]CAF1622954.1 unnamed protein product [Rotaria sp. Silwood1]CAF3721055.1 unnamed protein product [Rotaria sp. Silwood1]CAF3805845.1 unnamed protein product [Rotaria sp. Silwood1]CAF4669015.1 unnamed protein product [Rotaria sp. Silwood1]
MSTYCVVAGDTLWGISQRYGCTVDALMGANPGVRPEALAVGQILKLPFGASNNTLPTNIWPSPQGPLLPTGRTPNNARLDTTLSERAPSPIGQLRDLINPTAQATDMPADLIGAVIYQESGGNINVNTTTNPGNFGVDSGVMQVNEHTGAELQRKYPHRFVGLSGTAKEIMLGASYLKDMYDTIADRDWGITLRAYNSGPNGVDKNNLRAKPAGTGDSTYVDKVLRFWVDISQGNPLPPDHYASIYGRGF